MKGLGRDFCNDCIYGKQVKFSYLSGVIKKLYALDLVHSDVCTMLVNSHGGARYFVSFVDDFSRYTWIFTLKHKNEALSTFNVFKNQVENEFEK